MATKPSDRAIAQAFSEWADPSHFIPICDIREGIYKRARELDATAAPVVVGEVPSGHVLIGPNIVRFGAGNFDIVKVGQAAANIAVALAGD